MAMERVSLDPGRVVAVLGPTNTGKTHFAVERMLAHRSGMMGFPLRLLAREIYDRIVALRGPSAVALITGEEKLGPEDARYIIATVEAMPVHRKVAFLAIDEIQLCADPERGHVFTDRLLNARGTEETMFLGADTIRPLLKRLVPRAEVTSRPRLSLLSFDGHRKLSRLPRRTAIVGFTSASVYGLAETIRRQKGGAAVVMGALSPRTRNAQVALYQAGEVDYLVATDAIGMGLNMDVAHVAFATLRKFDGRQQRHLQANEVAQIAGRAGRHMSDGRFGTTGDCEPMETKLVEAVEGHSFPPLKALRWRNSALDFSSLQALLETLDEPAPADGLVRVRDALDHRSLAMLAGRDAIRAKVDHHDRVQLLWQVCQIPDFHKTLTDAHLHLLSTVFNHLTQGKGQLPNDWVGAMIARLDRTEGDIDALVQRIAQVRTWTYLTHHRDWLADPRHWQAMAREVEDKLSDALHERLTQRFVDRRTAVLMRSLREHGELIGMVEADGLVVVDGMEVGRVEGLRLEVEAATGDPGQKLLLAAARKAAGYELTSRIKKLVAADDSEISLSDDDSLVFAGAAVGRLVRGSDPLRPRLQTIMSEDVAGRHEPAVAARLTAWLERWIGQRMAPLVALRDAAKAANLAGPARGIAFRLAEHLGSLPRDQAEELLSALGEQGRRDLGRLGVRFGRLRLYVPALLRPAAIEARGRLWRIMAGLPVPLPPIARTVLRGEALPPTAEAIEAMGFMHLEGLAIRHDVAERLAAGLRARARSGPSFALPLDLAAQAGLGRQELEQTLPALGFVEQEENGERRWIRRELRRPTPARGQRDTRRDERRAAWSPFAALAALKAAP
jgi:ATP-dependent RNA helicase SUPV3L1/SUV3